MSSKIEELRQQVKNALDALRAAENDEFKAVTLPQMKAMIGQTFKYRNSYSGGESWWMYVIVTGISDDSLRTMQIQKCSDERIDVSNSWLSFPQHDGYERISREEFDRATKPILAEVAKLVRTKRKATT